MTTELSGEDHGSVIDSSGNVFADLNLPSSEEDMLKVQISRAIAATLRRRKLTQVDAAKIMCVDQAKVSALLRGRFKGFSVDRLFRLLILLGRDVDIHISDKVKDNGPGPISPRRIREKNSSAPMV